MATENTIYPELPSATQVLYAHVLPRIINMGGAYHNRGHIDFFIGKAGELADTYNLPSHTRKLLYAAILYHDLVQGSGHEGINAHTAEKELGNFGYSPADIKIIGDLIRVTRGEMEGERPFVTKPTDLLQKIMCDGDLAGLGSAKFPEFCDQLQTELKILSRKTWMQIELDFLTKHRYHTQNADNLWGEQKIENIEWIKNELANL